METETQGNSRKYELYSAELINQVKDSELSLWQQEVIQVRDQHSFTWLLCKQGGKGVQRSKARDQESNGTAQEPNELKSKRGRGRIIDIGDGMEIHSNHSDLEIREKREQRIISRFLA